MCNPRNSEPWHIDNSGIFRTLTYLKPDICSEPSQRFEMECFSKITKSYNYFSKVLCLRYFHKLSISRNLSIIINSDIFRHIHILFRHILPYCGIQNFIIFRVLTCSGPEAYPEPCLFRHIKVYSIMTFYNNIKSIFLH